MQDATEVICMAETVTSLVPSTVNTTLVTFRMGHVLGVSLDG